MKRASVVLFVLLVVAAISLTPTRTAEPLIKFDHYHTYAEITAFLKAVTQAHKDLAELVQIGESLGKRPIYAVEINNPKTGPAKDKPAFYIDGNIHGGEVVSGETALYMINMFLERAQSDPDVRKQLETTAFYVVPIVNPHGRVISVETPENHRGNIRRSPTVDTGGLTSWRSKDMDGDGRILQMRVKDPNGRWKISPDDPRLMVPRVKDETGGTYYTTLGGDQR
jgi:murein tripeptide amidase MpaA